MKKNHFVFYLVCITFICSVPGISAFAQEKNTKKISGEIVAYDALIPLYTSFGFAADINTLIVKTDSAKLGEFVLVEYSTFDFEFLKKVEKGSKIKLKAIRDENCDADVESLENVESDGVELPRMKWFDSEAPKPTSVMPCYTADHGIKFVK